MHLASCQRLVSFLPAAALALGLFLAGTGSASAQTMVAVSNLDEPAYAGLQVYTTDSSFYIRRGQSFTTGDSATLLESITVRISHANTPGTGFNVALYSDLEGNPGSLIETLSGDNNPSSGDYTYTSSGSLQLAANSTYWWVASMTQGGNQNISLTGTTSTAETGLSGWTIGNSHAYSLSADGDWSSSSPNLPQFSLNVSAVPEPSTYAAFAGFAALIGAFVWRRRKAVPVIAGQ